MNLLFKKTKWNSLGFTAVFMLNYDFNLPSRRGHSCPVGLETILSGIVSSVLCRSLNHDRLFVWISSVELVYSLATSVQPRQYRNSNVVGYRPVSALWINESLISDITVLHTV